MTTTLAIMLHEIPHEIGDFAVLIKKGYKIFGILLTQLATSLGAFVGGLMGNFLFILLDNLKDISLVFISKKRFLL